MQLTLLNSNLQDSGKFEVTDKLFAREWNGPLAHRISVIHAANARQGTRQQKTRAEVKHTTKKVYRQKGTGRSRVGTSSSPIRRGGARAFPASPKDNVNKDINRKEFRAGMSVILSQLVREDRVYVAEEIKSAEIKTKPCAKMVNDFAKDNKVLLVDTEFDKNFQLSVRNLYKVNLSLATSLLATDLVNNEKIVLSKRAVEKITGMWS